MFETVEVRALNSAIFLMLLGSASYKSLLFFGDFHNAVR